MSVYDTLYRVLFHFAVKRIQLETMTWPWTYVGS